MTSQRKRRPLSPRTGSILVEPDPIPMYSQTDTSNHEVDSIEEGDQVRHKIMDYLNNGLPLQVLATDGDKALCSYMDELSKAPVLTWYEKAELLRESSDADTNLNEE